jgi:multiple sugar transport system permease protein
VWSSAILNRKASPLNNIEAQPGGARLHALPALNGIRVMRTTAAPPISTRQTKKQSTRFNAAPYLFVAPFASLFLLFYIGPIAYAAWSSLFTMKRSGLGFGPAKLTFVGAENYFRAVSDPGFIHGIERVLTYGVVQVPVMLGIALLIALVLDETTSWIGRFARTAAFLPYTVPSVVGALVWGFLYEPSLSPIVKLMSAWHLGHADFLSAKSILWSIANIATWQWTGYNMLILFAALQTVPREHYEAARIDGCGAIRLAWHIKIPSVMPTLVMNTLMSIIGTLQLFNEPAVLKQISTSITADFTPNLYAYNVAFANNDYHYAAALAVELAVVTFTFSYLFMRLVRRHSGV